MTRDRFQAARALLERGYPTAAAESVTDTVTRLRSAPPEERWAAALALRTLICDAHRRARVLARQVSAPPGALPPRRAPGALLSWPA